RRTAPERHSPGRQSSHVRPLLRLQGRSGARALAHEAVCATPAVIMAGTSWAFSEDLPTWAIVIVALLVAGAAGLLLLELCRCGVRVLAALATGVVGVVLLGMAVLRPVRVTTEGQLAGAPVAVLVDQSRRLSLPAGNGTR